MYKLVSYSIDSVAVCLKPEEVKETGKGIGERITNLSWRDMKHYLRDQRSKLSLSKREQDNCKSQFLKGFAEALGGESSWNYGFYYPTVNEWFHQEEDEAFRPYFKYGGYGY